MLRILIVQLDSVTRIKLNQFLGSCGSCDVARSSKQAAEMFLAALQEDEPYRLVTIDSNLPDMPAADLMRRLKRQESVARPLPGYIKAQMLLVIPASVENHKSISAGFDAELRTPFDRKAVLDVIQTLNLSQMIKENAAPLGKRSTTQTSPSSESIEEERYAALLQQAATMSEVEFAGFVAKLVEQLGWAGDDLLVRALTSPQVERQALFSLTHAVGALKRSVLLPPLRDIAANNPNLNIRKEAILAIAGNANEQAVSLLNELLLVVGNVYLSGIINQELARITQKSPYLALIKTFREGSKDIKSFNNSMVVLKRILRPEETGNFFPLLESDDILVSAGAFELLAEKLGAKEGGRLFDHFVKVFDSTADSTDTTPGTRYHLAMQLERFFTRHPDAISGFGEQLILRFHRTEDPRVREIFLGILWACPSHPFLPFFYACYRERPELRQDLITRMVEDERCIDFLIEEYRKGGHLSQHLFASLLRSEKGCRYFADSYDRADMDLRLQILEGVEAHNYNYLRNVVLRSLQHSDRNLRALALEKVRIARDSEAGEVLFATNRQAELLQSEGSRIPVMAELFPFRTISLFLSDTLPREAAARLLQDQLEVFKRLCVFEPVPTSLSSQIFDEILRSTAAISYETRCQCLLYMLQKIKAYHRSNFAVLQEALMNYVDLRQRNFVPQEALEVKKCRESHDGLVEDIRSLEEGYRNLDLLLRKPQLSYEQLNVILRAHHPAFCLRRQEIISRLRDALNSQDTVEFSKARGYIIKHPLLVCYFQDFLERLRLFPTQHIGPQERPRFNLHLEDKMLSAFIREHLEDLFPEFAVVTGAPVQSDDWWVSDYAAFQKIATTQNPACRKKLVVLSDPPQFQEIKEFNPVIFLSPLSIYRLMKALILDLFL